MLKESWTSLGVPARLGLACGFAFILAATIGMAAWVMRVDYQVLFADLKPQDTAMMAAELDRLKVPYKVGADGNTILVDGGVVHSTRLKLMGKDLPLHGAAGFELFNNADFGMTEFAQKINYQRALQGEITRTILSLSEVKDVRVHLALPEEGLFKRPSSKAKASITLGLKAGQSLRPEQITGIQRLVSGAVPGIVAHDVTIVDQHGVALTRPAPGDGEQDSGSVRLDLKRDTERLLARKATAVLEGTFGVGQALASVDVTLNMDQVRVTTEDVLGAPTRVGQNQAGVMVREREVIRDGAAPLNAHPDNGRPGTAQREADYQVGRRVEQVASQPGAIRRLHAVAVIRQPMSEVQTEEMRELVAAAVGAMPERGDTVVVKTLRAFESAVVDDAAASSKFATRAPPAADPASMDSTSMAAVIGSALLLVVALVAGVSWLVWRPSQLREPRPLTVEQRHAVLQQMREWLDSPGART